MPTIFKPEPKNREVGRIRRSDRNKDNECVKYVYNTNTWRALRLAYIAEHVFCERCETLVLAQHVHHKIPISKGIDRQSIESLGFDWNNLEALCRECHRLEHVKPTFIYD